MAAVGDTGLHEIRGGPPATEVRRPVLPTLSVQPLFFETDVRLSEGYTELSSGPGGVWKIYVYVDRLQQ